MTASSRFSSPLDIELQRLQSLLPDSLQGRVLVNPSSRSLPDLIRCGENPRGWMVIEISSSQWSELPQGQRDLLFWHQVARIQEGTAPREGWERAALFLGLGGMAGEIWVQDGLLLSLCLGLVAVAGYRLYQRRWQHRGPVLIQADRGALRLATRAGYTPTTALKSLSSALHRLQEQASSPQQQALYAARLDALDQV